MFVRVMALSSLRETKLSSSKHGRGIHRRAASLDMSMSTVFLPERYTNVSVLEFIFKTEFSELVEKRDWVRTSESKEHRRASSKTRKYEIENDMDDMQRRST